jgi:alpha-ketoglutarate-dependent taurine dioxygenase
VPTIAELERIAACVVRCDACGNPWYHDWLSAETCPHCALAASQSALLRLRKRSQNQRRELRRLNNALRWLWDGVRYAHAMEAKMRADKELGDAKKLAKFWEETAGSLKQEVIDLMHGCRTHNVHDAR